MKNRFLPYSCLVWILLTNYFAVAQFRLPMIIGDNMVLQRNQEVPVWGWASPGSEVNVKFSGQEKKTLARGDGYWKIVLRPLKASDKPSEMTISAQDTIIRLSNILVGEVWLCSGQSNMEYTMKRTYQAPPAKGVDSAELELTTNNSQIRLFKVDEILTKPDVTTDGWKESGNEALEKFSTVGYYFAKDLNKQLHVPVGIIFSAVGGTPIEFWTPSWAFRLLPPAKADSINRQPFMLDPKRSSLYDGMIFPLAPFALKGVLWYQGEANCALNESSTYTDKLQVMTEGWRKDWGNKNLPFYSVLLAPYYYTSVPNLLHTPQTLPEFWQGQIASLRIPHTEIIAITDLVDDLKDIHPSYKWEVGRRLSLVALAKTYQYQNIEYSGPRYQHMEVKGNKIVLYFSHTRGLKSSDDKSLTWFTIAGKDNEFVNADATIAGNKIVVTSPDVLKPVNVRFAWDETAQPNLFNSSNLPAFPFQTNAKR